MNSPVTPETVALLKRIKRAWLTSHDSSSHDFDEWIVSLLTDAELAQIAERAEKRAKATPRPDGYCRWGGHDYWGEMREVKGLEACKDCAERYELSAWRSTGEDT